MDTKGDFKSNKKYDKGAQEMNQQLRPPDVLAESVGSGPSNHGATYKIL